MSKIKENLSQIRIGVLSGLIVLFLGFVGKTLVYPILSCVSRNIPTEALMITIILLMGIILVLLIPLVHLAYKDPAQEAWDNRNK